MFVKILNQLYCVIQTEAVLNQW